MEERGEGAQGADGGLVVVVDGKAEEGPGGVVLGVGSTTLEDVDEGRDGAGADDAGAVRRVEGEVEEGGGGVGLEEWMTGEERGAEGGQDPRCTERRAAVPAAVPGGGPEEEQRGLLLRSLGVPETGEDLLLQGQGGRPRGESRRLGWWAL